jgi:hypothetical protein
MCRRCCKTAKVMKVMPVTLFPARIYVVPGHVEIPISGETFEVNFLTAWKIDETPKGTFMRQTASIDE